MLIEVEIMHDHRSRATTLHQFLTITEQLLFQMLRNAQL